MNFHYVADEFRLCTHQAPAHDQVALILLMETVCGPLWVFLRFGDAPSVWTLAGGAVLICALAVHELLGLRAAVGSGTASPGGASTSPASRMTLSPPLPSAQLLRTAAGATVVPVCSDGDHDYHCFAGTGARSHPGKHPA